MEDVEKVDFLMVLVPKSRDSHNFIRFSVCSVIPLPAQVLAAPAGVIGKFS